MSSSRGLSSNTPAKSVKVKIQDYSSDQVSEFRPSPIIIPATRNLSKIIKLASSSEGIASDYIETLDVRDIVEKYRISSASSSTKMLSSRKITLWQFMSSTSVRLPYRTSLWSLFLKGLSTQAQWFEMWAMFLHEAQVKNIMDSEVLIEIQALRNCHLMLVMPPMSVPVENFTQAMIERDRLQMPLLHSDIFSRVPFTFRLQVNFAFIVEGRVHKDLKLNIHNYLCLDSDELHYKVKVQPDMPEWYKNWKSTQINNPGWIDDDMKVQEDKLYSDEREMKLVYWHVRGVKRVGFKRIFK